MAISRLVVRIVLTKRHLTVNWNFDRDTPVCNFLEIFSITFRNFIDAEQYTFRDLCHT